MRKDQLRAFMQNVKVRLQSLTGRCKKEIIMKTNLIYTKARKVICLPGRAIGFISHLFRRLASVSSRVKYIALSTFLILAVVASTSVYAYYDSFTFVVYLDGEEVGYVTSETVVPEMLASLQAQEEKERGADVSPKQSVTVEYEQRKGAQEDDEDVLGLLKEKMEYAQYAYMIMVNQRPILAVASIEDYESVMENLKSAYVKDQENTVVQAIVLNDQVEARLVQVEPHEIRSVEEASDILQGGTNKREVYLVSRGDSLWTIANRKNVTIADIRSANPQIEDLDRLMPGDEINLTVADPLVDVTVTEDVVVAERIAYQTEYKNDSSLYKGQTKVLKHGEYGVKEVTYRVSLQNGREIERQPIEEKVVEEPTVKVVARGTKALPAGSGTGRFLWPVAGRGRVTSGYGYRWGSFHRGVDIGTATGTPILAADSGTVIQSGWAGSYGILVTIDHGNGYVTKYAHNSATLVSVGQKIQRGQQIARSGSTGNSTGPHLHFEIIKNGSNVNPLSYL